VPLEIVSKYMLPTIHNFPSAKANLGIAPLQDEPHPKLVRLLTTHALLIIIMNAVFETPNRH
jgi:hypothetical protein